MQDAQREGHNSMAGARIFVVDDEPDLLELVRYNLAKAGYQVTCVGLGEDALHHVSTHPPDLIVFDLLLPGVDGLDVCKTRKQNPPTHLIPS